MLPLDVMKHSFSYTIMFISLGLIRSQTKRASQESFESCRTFNNDYFIHKRPRISLRYELGYRRNIIVQPLFSNHDDHALYQYTHNILCSAILGRIKSKCKERRLLRVAQLQRKLDLLL